MAKKKNIRPAGGRPLGDQLRGIIEGRGLTAYAVGKMSGVNTSMVQRFLDGERDLRLESAGRIAEALGLRLVESGSRKGKASMGPAMRPTRAGGDSRDGIGPLPEDIE
jgi:transcriptional regulator with XRE-family HTH domain